MYGTCVGSIPTHRLIKFTDMNALLKKFTYLSDVVDRIDQLTELAAKCRKQKEKSAMLKEAQGLVDAYEDHIGRKVFNHIHGTAPKQDSKPVPASPPPPAVEDDVENHNYW